MAEEPYARRSVEVHGLATGYLEAGSDTAPPLLLLHDGGYGSDAESCWAPFIPLMAERFHVFAPDLLGHGRSPKVYHFDMDPFAQRLRHVSAFCEALGIRRPFGIGNSFGGAMLLHGAARGLLATTASVSICGTGGLFMDEAGFARIRAYEPTEEDAAHLAGVLLRHPSADEIARRLEATLQPGHWEALSAARVRNPTRPPSDASVWVEQYRNDLTRVQTPFLLIAGSDDPLMEPGWQTALAALLPNGRAVVVDDAHHQPHLDHPEQVAALILGFFDTITAVPTVAEPEG